MQFQRRSIRGALWDCLTCSEEIECEEYPLTFGEYLKSDFAKKGCGLESDRVLNRIKDKISKATEL